MTKGIILAGGSGTRLHPLTIAISKQILPVYNKPMIYYPLSILMLGGVDDVLIISTPTDQPLFKQLLGDGSDLGISISYAIQPSPDGLAQALIIGEKFIDNQPSMMILGDNIFFGTGLHQKIKQALSFNKGATVFGYEVADPEQYGVVNFDDENNVIGITEKPTNPQSNYAVTGLYVYDKDASYYAKQIKPSARGELEITSLNNIYLEEKKLNVELLGRGFSWFDTGTHDSLLEAASFVKAIEHRQGHSIGCPEEVAYHVGFIDSEKLLAAASKYNKNNYGRYLAKVATEKQLYLK